MKVLIIGIDGGTFDVADPLLADGKLPTMRRLIEAGVRAKLRSQDPMLSPAIWTTIATGRERRDHHIHDFVSDGGGDKPELVTSADRNTLAIWNIVSPLARSVGVVGWWVTWPAEPVRGFLVSDGVAHSRWQEWTDGAKAQYQTWPMGLFDEIKPLIVDPVKAPPMGEIDQLVTLNDTERRELIEATRPILFHGPSVFKFGYCEQRTYEEIALRQFADGQPDLGMVFLISVDPVSHTYWHFRRAAETPTAYGGRVDPKDAARLAPLIPALYEHNDAYIARLLSRVDPNTVVIIVSDHGFRPSGQLPGETTVVDYAAVGVQRRETFDRPINVGMSGWHHLDGLFVASGGPIRRGATPASQPSVLDITPTVLALMGLPVPRDMPGRVLEELIEPEFLKKYPVTRIDSYEPLIDRAQLAEAAQSDDESRRKYLESLGYLVSTDEEFEAASTHPATQPSTRPVAAPTQPAGE